jgi:hypothetical protein
MWTPSYAANGFTPTASDLSFGANSAAAPPGGASTMGGGFNLLNPFSWFGGGSNSKTPAPDLSKTGAAGLPFGLNLGTGQLALSGLGTLGDLWMGWNAEKLAGDQFDFQKKFANANLGNQTQAYNTSLADKAYARYAVENRPTSEADAYIAANKLPNRTV